MVFNAPTGVQKEHDIINYYNCDLAPGGISPAPTIITPRKSFDILVNDNWENSYLQCVNLYIYESWMEDTQATSLEKLTSMEIKALVGSVISLPVIKSILLLF